MEAFLMFLLWCVAIVAAIFVILLVMAAVVIIRIVMGVFKATAPDKVDK